MGYVKQQELVAMQWWFSGIRYGGLGARGNHIILLTMTSKKSRYFD